MHGDKAPSWDPAGSKASTVKQDSWCRTLLRGARRATCSTARSSVTLMCSPLNMASIFSRSFARSARLVSSCTNNAFPQPFIIITAWRCTLHGKRHDHALHPWHRLTELQEGQECCH